MSLNQINWAPIIGILLVLTGVVSLAFNLISSTDAVTLLTMGLATLGIHSSIGSLGAKLGASR